MSNKAQNTNSPVFCALTLSVWVTKQHLQCKSTSSAIFKFPMRSLGATKTENMVVKIVLI